MTYYSNYSRSDSRSSPAATWTSIVVSLAVAGIGSFFHSAHQKPKDTADTTNMIRVTSVLGRSEMPKGVVFVPARKRNHFKALTTSINPKSVTLVAPEEGTLAKNIGIIKFDCIDLHTVRVQVLPEGFSKVKPEVRKWAEEGLRNLTDSEIKAQYNLPEVIVLNPSASISVSVTNRNFQPQ